jgi:membrane-bound lytic murein transglycosylase B
VSPGPRAVALALGAVACLAPRSVPTQAPTFTDWLADVRGEALGRGISQATVDAALSGLEPEPVIIARDRAQPEAAQSLDDYVADRLSPKTVVQARASAAGRRDLLDRVQAAYGVPGSIMIALWAIESNFGQFTGVRPTVSALATLAYDSRRPDLFRHELFEALTILDRGLARPSDLKGSWAGAMGQPQFMPSSYLKYAVDFDGDGRADIWSSEPDVFASMANYLKQAGWAADGRWGREVRVSKAALGRIEATVPMRTAGCRALREMTEPRPLADWRQLGVTLLSGEKVPALPLEASLVRGLRRRFLAYRNYEAIIQYNCSNAYAVSVGLLSDKTAGR